MNTSTHTPGSFCTAVLRTREIASSAAFYREIVGWTAEELPAAADHRLLNCDGKTVASLQQATGEEDLWVPHVSVESIERTTKDALTLGATLVDMIDVPKLARLATVRDPEGALFGLWQPAPHHGAEAMEHIGSLWWIEVLSNDVAGAREFYGRLFGWTSADTSVEPFAAYTVFKRGDVQEGGILPIGRDWNVSPLWNSIFAVADCDLALERGQALGGSVVFVHTVPKHGRIGSLRDPGGAMFVMRGPVP
jgi:uncharacterized protein